MSQEPFPFRTEKKRHKSLAESAMNAMVLYSAEAEKAVLGSMLARPDAVIEVVEEHCNRSDFFVPAHQELFETLCEMHEHGHAVDVMTVHQNLVDRDLAAEVGSPGILAELATGLATHLNVMAYIKIVKDKSLLRHLQHACADIVQRISDSPEQPDKVLAEAEAEIENLVHRRNQNESLMDPEPESIVRETLDHLEAVHAGQIIAGGHDYGIPKLTEYTGGAKEAEYVLLAARTSVGKTALAIQFRNHFCKQDLKVGIISLEMINKHLQLRTVSAEAKVDGMKIFRGPMSEDEMQRVRDASARMVHWKMWHCDLPSLDMRRMRGIAKMWKKKRGLDVLIIDYIQLIQPEESDSYSRENEVSKISQGIKALTKELAIPIIALAQLNRKAEESGNPQLHHLRESGSLEHDADTVLLLHCEVPKEKQPGMAHVPHDLFIAKQRNGPLQKVPLIGIKNQFRFMPDEPSYPQI
jgi:replicative DNA helicase